MRCSGLLSAASASFDVDTIHEIAGDARGWARRAGGGAIVSGAAAQPAPAGNKPDVTLGSTPER